jgi:hypothetical protein
LIECEIFDIALWVADAIAHFFMYTNVHAFPADLGEAIAANQAVPTI